MVNASVLFTLPRVCFIWTRVCLQVILGLYVGLVGIFCSNACVFWPRVFWNLNKCLNTLIRDAISAYKYLGTHAVNALCPNGFNNGF